MMKVDPAKLNVLAFDNYQHGYCKLGEKAGQVWDAGKKFMD